jgi:hypothetical protein
MNNLNLSPLSSLLLFTGCLAIFSFFANGCATPPDYPIIPHIEYVGVSKDTLRRGPSNQDSTFVTFSFTDGDGDIGHPDTLDLFVTDTRTNVIEKQFIIPVVPELGASNGIKGKITARFFTTCCVFPDTFLNPCTGVDPTFLYDKVVYEIFIKDRAGHQSNTIQTEPIFIRCF